MLPADAGQHLGDVRVLAVEGRAALAEVPAETCEAPLDRAHVQRALAAGLPLGRERRDVETDQLRVRGGLEQPAFAAPSRVGAPVGLVSAARVLRASAAGIVARLFDQGGVERAMG